MLLLDIAKTGLVFPIRLTFERRKKENLGNAAWEADPIPGPADAAGEFAEFAR
jgi:hypothetical protein